MFLLFSSCLCNLAGPTPIPLPNGGGPWIFLREATLPLHPGGPSKPNLANGCVSSSDHNHWFDGSGERSEHQECAGASGQGAQLVGPTSGEAGSHRRHDLGTACLRMRPAQGTQDRGTERGTLPRLKKNNNLNTWMQLFWIQSQAIPCTLQFWE